MLFSSQTHGLFDLSKSERLLAEYRLLHPSPLSSPVVAQRVRAEADERDRPKRQSSDPQGRYSLSVLQLPPYWPTTSPLTSPSDSPRLNPFAFGRKSMVRPRPNHTKSASEIPLASGAASPLEDLTNDRESATSALYTVSQSLARGETLKAEKRGVRKLRKAPPPRISVRTDDSTLLRPEAALPDYRSTRSGYSGTDGSEKERRMSWHSAASSSRQSRSPLTYEPEDLQTLSMPQSPSHGADMASQRRPLSIALNYKRREATSTSADSAYYADSERHRACSTRSSFGVASSPTSSVSSPSRWSRPWGFDRLKRAGSSTPASPVVGPGGDGDAHDPLSADLVRFQVLSRPSPRLSMSNDCPASAGGHVAGDARGDRTTPDDVLLLALDSPSLKHESHFPRIDSPRPGAGTQRRTLARGISYDSMHTPSGCHTPAVVSTASSGTIRAPDLTGMGGFAGGDEGEGASNRAKLPEGLSALMLSDRSADGASANDDHPGASEYSQPQRADSRKRATPPSFGGSSSSSQRSRSRSRDSMSGLSGDETPASSAVEGDDGYGLASQDEDQVDTAKSMSAFVPPEEVAVTPVA